MKTSEMKNLLKEKGVEIPKGAKKADLELLIASLENKEEKEEVAVAKVQSDSRRFDETDIADVKTIINWKTGQKIQKYYNAHGDVVKKIVL